VIVKAAIIGDVRDWPISFNEQTRGGGEPGLHNELIGGGAKNAFDKAGEANRRQTRALGQELGEMGSSQCASRYSNVLARLVGMLSRSPGARKSREIPTTPTMTP